jgi:hypothetical protein
MSGLLSVRGALRLLLACTVASATLGACQPRTAGSSDETVVSYLGFKHGMTRREVFSYLCKNEMTQMLSLSDPGVSGKVSSLAPCSSFDKISKYETWTIWHGGRCFVNITFSNDKVTKIEQFCQHYYWIRQ